MALAPKARPPSRPLLLCGTSGAAAVTAGGRALQPGSSVYKSRGPGVRDTSSTSDLCDSGQVTSIRVNSDFIVPLGCVFQALEFSSKQDRHGLAVMDLPFSLGSQTTSAYTSKRKERVSGKGYVF